MKFFATIYIFSVLLVFGSQAEDFPARSNTIVTDFTNALSAGEQQTLEQKLVAFNDSTSTQIAVVILASVGSYDISEYAIQLYNKWGVGQKATNNGVLILVAKEDRKAFIATGYGMEGVLPDALCKRVVNNDLIPNFKKGKFYEGLDEATTSIIGIVKGEYSAEEYLKSREPGIPWFMVFIFLLILAIVFFARIHSVRSYARKNDLTFWAAWALMNAALNRRSSHGSWGGFSSGGGFGGGGFGGFGGGRSGGGGAGGSW